MESVVSLIKPYLQGPALMFLGVVGFWLFAAGLFGKIAKEFADWEKLIGISPFVLFMVGVGFGSLSTLVGGLPYFFDKLPFPNKHFPNVSFDGSFASKESVRFWRLVVFGGAIGGSLSLAFTWAAMSFKRGTLPPEQRVRINKTWLVASIVIIAVVAVGIASKMSEFGRAVSKSLALGAAPIAEVHPLIKSFHDDPGSLSFGSGMCRDLNMYYSFQNQKITETGMNNQCDVGPIQFTYVVFSISVFNGLWLAFLYWIVGSKKKGGGIAALRGRSGLYLLVTFLLVLVAVALSEPWAAPEDASAGREKFINTFPGLALVALMTASMCMVSLLILKRDIEALLVALPVPSGKRGKKR